MAMNGTGYAHTNGSSHTNGSALKNRRPLQPVAPSAAEPSSKSALRPPPGFWEWCLRWEIPRKVLHSSIGFVTLVLYFLRPPHMSPIITPLCVALSVIVSADAIRFRSSAFERAYERLLGFLMRDAEKTSINGVVWYLIGVVFVLAVYPRDVAVEAILLLSWADTAASTFGRLYGHRTPRLPNRILGLPVAARKSLAGVFGSFTIAMLTTLTFWGFCTSGMGKGLPEASWQWTQPGTGGWAGLLLLSASAGVVTSIVEVLDFGDVDDNLTLPVLAGALVWGITIVLRTLSDLL